jgi:chromosome segregation ATPase
MSTQPEISEHAKEAALWWNSIQVPRLPDFCLKTVAQRAIDSATAELRRDRDEDRVAFGKSIQTIAERDAEIAELRRERAKDVDREVVQRDARIAQLESMGFDDERYEYKKRIAGLESQLSAEQTTVLTLGKHHRGITDRAQAAELNFRRANVTISELRTELASALERETALICERDQSRGELASTKEELRNADIGIERQGKEILRLRSDADRIQQRAAKLADEAQQVVNGMALGETKLEEALAEYRKLSK